MEHFNKKKINHRSKFEKLMVQELALRQSKMLKSLIYIGDIAQLAHLCVTRNLPSSYQIS